MWWFFRVASSSVGMHERHYWSIHMDMCFETSYLTWVTLYGESLIGHDLHVMI